MDEEQEISYRRGRIRVPSQYAYTIDVQVSSGYAREANKKSLQRGKRFTNQDAKGYVERRS